MPDVTLIGHELTEFKETNSERQLGILAIQETRWGYLKWRLILQVT